MKANDMSRKEVEAAIKNGEDVFVQIKGQHHQVLSVRHYLGSLQFWVVGQGFKFRYELD